MTKKAIITGATSGIGKALAQLLSNKGYSLGLTGRRTELLEELKSSLPGSVYICTMDVAQKDEAMEQFQQLIDKLDGLDLAIINAGCGQANPDLNWEMEKQVIDVNVMGFAATANVAMRHFIKQGHGHLVGISSVAAIRGYHDVPAYNASKAFVSNYLQGLRHKAVHARLPITVTDIKPGFVDTKMAQGEKIFWRASTEVAANQIYRAIVKKKSHAYVTKRWRLIAWLVKLLPQWLAHKL
ncbi:MAG: SDR family NAD(P)-dependent oxidoreductase [Phycisphaerae bacterium]|nr:SDR family NAD(P)-dependent oxidoreductase [Phycisphaerae bacterium]